MVAKRVASDFNRQVADILFGEYKKKRLSQATIAPLAGFNATTLQRKLAGKAPLDVEELSLIAGAIGVDPSAVLEEALEAYGGLPKLMSEVATTTDDLAAQRATRQQRLAEMGTADIERLPGAAQQNTEEHTPEPDAP